MTGQSPSGKIVKIPGETSYQTISEAIADAKSGDRVLIQPGIYAEEITLSSSITLVGLGQPEDVIIQSRLGTVIQCIGGEPVIENITVEKILAEPGNGISITSGNPTIKDCIVRGATLPGIFVGESSFATINACTIQDCITAGVLITGKAIIQNCSIFSNQYAGIEVKDGADPTIQDNQIYNGQEAGILVWRQAKGTITGNDIYQNRLSGIEIREHGNPIVRNNKISEGRQAGILIHQNASGLIENNDLTGNYSSGIAIQNKANPIIISNTITQGKEAGIVIFDNALGRIEGNNISNNQFSGIEIKTGGSPELISNKIFGNGGGIMVHNGGQGRAIKNDVRGNIAGPWYIAPESDSLFQREDNIDADEKGAK